jgi:hypothetical protein
VLPVGLVLARVYLRRPWFRRDILRIAPLFVMSAASAITTMLYETAKNPGMKEELAKGLGHSLAIVGFNIWFYLGKLVAPVDLALCYEKWRIDTHSVWTYAPIAGVVGLFAVLWFLRRRCGHGPFLALAFYIAALMPVLGLFTFFYQRLSDVADHFQYLPSLGLIALFAGVVSHAGRRLSEAGLGGLRFAGRLAALALLCACWGATWKHCHYYKDNYTIWGYTLTKSPNSWLVHEMFATASARREEYEAAIEHYRERIERGPDSPRVYVELGRCLEEADQLVQAESAYLEAMRLYRKGARPPVRLGFLYLRLERWQEAVDMFERALELNPGRGDAHAGLADALSRLGRHDEALEHQRKADELIRRRSLRNQLLGGPGASRGSR